MSVISTTLAIVLKRRNVGEADRIMTLLTRDGGKCTVIAKGVRGATSKRAAHVELFNTIKAQLIERKGMSILAQTELVSDRSSIKSHLKLLRIAYHLVEVTEKLTPDGQRQEEVFDLLDRALSSINMDQWNNEERLTNAFEMKLLALLGYGLSEDPKKTQQYIEELIERKLRSRTVLKD